MSDDDALRLYFNAGLAEGFDDVLVGKPVEPEAANALVKELARQTRQLSNARHRPVKGRIEAGNLGDIGPSPLQRLHSRHVTRKMQWREVGHLAQHRNHFGGNRLVIDVKRPTMHDAMACCRDRMSREMLFDRRHENSQCSVVIGEIASIINDTFTPYAVSTKATARKTDAIERTPKQARQCGLGPKQCEFDARRTGIENEDGAIGGHAWSKCRLEAGDTRSETWTDAARPRAAKSSA